MKNLLELYTKKVFTENDIEIIEDAIENREIET